MNIQNRLVDEYKTHNYYLKESIKDKNKEISKLKNRVEELEGLKSHYMKQIQWLTKHYDINRDEASSYKQALEYLLDSKHTNSAIKAYILSVLEDEEIENDTDG